MKKIFYMNLVLMVVTIYFAVWKKTVGGCASFFSPKILSVVFDIANGTMYSRMDQVRFVEDSL